MKIIWARQTKKEKKKTIEANAKDSKATMSKLSEKEPDEIIVFTVIPD